MASYSVLFDRDVEKDLSGIPRGEVRRIMARLLALSDNPHPPHSAKIEGAASLYRLRIGNYRAIYQIDRAGMSITVYRVRHRKDVYRSLRK